MKNLLACILLLTATISFGQQTRVVKNFSYNERMKWFDYVTLYEVNDGALNEYSGIQVNKTMTHVNFLGSDRHIGLIFTDAKSGERIIFDFTIINSVRIITDLDGSEYHLFDIIDNKYNVFSMVISEKSVMIQSDDIAYHISSYEKF